MFGDACGVRRCVVFRLATEKKDGGGVAVFPLNKKNFGSVLAVSAIKNQTKTCVPVLLLTC